MVTEIAMHRVLYVSRASARFDRATLDQLAAAAVRRNASEGISGAMLHSAGYFLQWFEGPEPAVATLWRRLLADPRHVDLRPLAVGPVAARRFEGWAMLRLFDAAGDVDREAPLATLRSAGVAARLLELSLPKMLSNEAGLA